MIIRARPKYLENINFNELNDECMVNYNEFYFNSGRAALKFFLEHLASMKNKTINIALQAFNCSVVLDAALEANCEVYLLDIKLDDFSISENSLKKLIAEKELDVLLLTHYQGIVNSEYINIINLCKRNNILVIEDLAQTYGSGINNIKVGTLGDINLYSYAFDKPFTCLNGGMLKFNMDIDDIFYKKYLELNSETRKDAILDIKTLAFLYKYTSENYYKVAIDNVELIKFFIKINFPEKVIYKLLENKIIYFLYRIKNKIHRLTSKISRDTIKIKKLDFVKLNLIERQEKNYNYNNDAVENIKILCQKYFIEYHNSSEIHWNRFSVIDKDENLKNYLYKKGYQVDNFNWSRTLDLVNVKNSKVSVCEELKNSHYASKYILNIPIWKNNDK